MGDFYSWTRQQLQTLLGFEGVNDIMEHMIMMEDKELLAYLQGLLGKTNQASKFITLFKERRRKHTPGRFEVPVGVQVYQKDKDDDLPLSKRGKKKEPQPVTDYVSAAQSGVPVPTNKKKKSKSKGITKLEDVENLLVPGRVECECQGTRHSVLTNCIGCGKIICEQEGYGKCYFCGFMVKAPRGEEVRNAKLEKAIKHKDTLINYDRTSAQRTLVLDDQSDYFSVESNQWLSKNERDKITKSIAEQRAKADEAKNKRTVSKRRRVIVDKPEVIEINLPDASSSSSAPVPATTQAPKPKPPQASPYYNPYIDVPQPKFVSEKKKPPGKKPAAAPKKQLASSKRIQHQYFGVDEVQEDDADVYTPFQICGVLEGAWMQEQQETGEQEIATNTLAKLQQAMNGKGSGNHLVVFPDKRASWRERFVRRTENEISSLRKTCADKKIDLVCGVSLDSGMKLMSSEDLNLLVTKINFLVKLGVSRFALFLNQVMPAGEEQTGGEFAVEQAKFVNLVATEVQQFSDSLNEEGIQWFILPSYFYADFSGLSPLPRNQDLNQCRYWKSFNSTLNPQFYLYFQLHHLAKYAPKLSTFFPNRRIIALEQFPDPTLSLPPPSSSSPDFLSLDPFELPPGGDLEKLPSLVSGVVVSSRSLPYAASASEWGLVSILTFLDFARNPTHYRQMVSLKSALTSVLKDERVVSDLMDILAALPSKMLMQADIEALRKGVNTKNLSSASARNVRAELRVKLHAVLSALKGDSLSLEGDPFFKRVDAVLGKED